MIKVIKYPMSVGSFGDGKSVCLWRQDGSASMKIVRFQSDEASRMFAEEFDFPLGENTKKRIYPTSGQ